MSPPQGLHSPWPQQRQCSVNHRNELSDLVMVPVPGACGGVGMEAWGAVLSLPHRSVRSAGCRKKEEQNRGPSEPPEQDVVPSKQPLEESPLS